MPGKKGSKHYKSISDIKEKVKELWGDDYSILEDDKFKYENVHQHVKFKCNKCGKIYSKRINSLLHGYGCKYCAGRYFENSEEMKKYVSEATGGEYELISDNFKTREKATFKHNSEKCLNTNPEHTFEMKIHNFTVLKERCPFCNKTSLGIRVSHGNIKIREYLRTQKIDFITEQRFDGCKNASGKEFLSFDIFVPEYDLLIEYDGIQHRKPVKYFGGEESFLKTKENDEIKNQFVKNHEKYRLLRISDLEFSKIDEILDRTFNDYRKDNSEEISE